MKGEIKYLPHSAINQHRWNRRIETAVNSRIYARYEYLEQMARGQWDALIMGDYELLMPLPWRKKYGIYYVYQPAFIAAGGLFGDGLSSENIRSFIESIPARFKLVEMPMNAGNRISMPGIFQRQNFVLDLSRSYADLYTGFRESTKRNIKKAGQSGCTIAETTIENVIALNRAFMSRVNQVDEEDYKNFEELFRILNEKKQAKILAVEDAGNNILAAAVFFFDAHRAYYILVGNTANGKTLGASHFLINAFIEQHAGSKLLLDFEGSDIQSLAFFYSSFGAIPEPYAALRVNRLPRLLRWLK